MWALQRAGDVGSMGCYTTLPTESAVYSEPGPGSGGLWGTLVSSSQQGIT